MGTRIARYDTQSNHRRPRESGPPRLAPIFGAARTVPCSYLKTAACFRREGLAHPLVGLPLS